MKTNRFFGHIGVSINDPSDIENFYVDILKMNIENKFTLNASLAEQIFNVPKEIEVITVNKNDLTIELFISDSNLNRFSHICISVDNREALIKKVKEKKYPCIIIRKNPFDMVFIRDNSNNLFEIK